MNIFTIGFTKKTAQTFFELLKANRVDFLIDIRLNNTSQLASFAKYPDIEYFLSEITGITYMHDKALAPTDKLLKDYKNGLISWEMYKQIFTEDMSKKGADNYIKSRYQSVKDKNICLLCSEDTHEKCHRSIVSEYFSRVFNAPISHL